MFIRFIFIAIYLFFFQIKAEGQLYNVNIVTVEEYGMPVVDSIHFDNIDSISLFSSIDSICRKDINQGYLGVSIDTIQLFDSLSNIIIIRGKKYNWRKISVGDSTISVSDEYKGGIEYLESIYKYKLEEVELDGYPLAKIVPVSFDIVEDSIDLLSFIDTVGRVYFDTIEIIGGTNLSYVFISDYLEIKKGDIYSSNKLSSVSRRINSLDYIGMKEDPLIVFYGNRCKLVLNVYQQKNNIFDFLIGILPQGRSEESKWLITGDVTLSLYNKIGFGEHIYFDYKKYKVGSQEMNFNLNLPFIKKLPFGVTTSLSLLKDSDKYISIHGNAGIQYRNKNSVYYIDWKFHNSRLLSIDSNRILKTLKLPEDLDYSYNGISLGISDIRLDHKTNPRRGYKYNVNVGVGLKKTIVNQKILSLRNNSIDFSASYDSLELEKIQVEVSGSIDKFVPIWDKSTLLFGVSIHGKFDNGNLLKNEKYKIGGSNNLRGFDEESLFVGIYGLLNVEYRLLLSQNAHLSFPFLDIVAAKHDVFADDIDMYYGIGGGLSFETKAGLFNFSVAVGKSPISPFDFKRPKVHFGYLNIF